MGEIFLLIMEEYAEEVGIVLLWRVAGFGTLYLGFVSGGFNWEADCLLELFRLPPRLWAEAEVDAADASLKYSTSLKIWMFPPPGLCLTLSMDPTLLLADATSTRVFKILTFPPPGLCFIFMVEPTLEPLFHSSFCVTTFFSPPPGLWFAFCSDPTLMSHSKPKL